MDKVYQPINCSLYDYLEMWSIKKTKVKITYIEDGTKKLIEDVLIKDLKTKNKEEFMLLSNEHCLRLDQLVRINEIDFTIQSC